MRRFDCAEGILIARLLWYWLFMADWDLIRLRWEVFGSKLDERGRRLFSAAEARTAGHGGVSAIAKITGLAAFYDWTRPQRS